MLVYDAETGEDRCTACGICAKVCPPQCIWIVRAKDESGKPVTRPAEFYIDTTICMNCGLCAEFCPFDAIKMNHDFEIAAYERMPKLMFDLEKLRVPTTYYARIRPTDWAAEEAARAAKEAEKAAEGGAQGRGASRRPRSRYQEGKMTVKITYHGHACFSIQTDTANLLIDPFLTGNEMADVSADQVDPDYILVSHAHGDHLGTRCRSPSAPGRPSSATSRSPTT